MVLAVAAAGNIAGQVGDLCESAFKRGAGVKDSGTTLPGHGGWLDRIDSSLFSIPVVYALLRVLTYESRAVTRDSNSPLSCACARGVRKPYRHGS